MLRGRKLARIGTLGVVAGLGLTAMINPDFFLSALNMPTAEERAESKQQRKNQQPKKPEQRLTQQDIERLAKLRDLKARKHLINILVRLEERIVIAEKAEAATTARFRLNDDLFPSLQGLISAHSAELVLKVRDDVASMRGAFAKQGGRAFRNDLGELSQDSYRLQVASAKYSADPSPDSLDVVSSYLTSVQEKLAGFESQQLAVSKQTYRYLASMQQNVIALKTQDRDLAVRGFAQPEDHPLSAAQRLDVRATCSPFEISRLHELSQEMSLHYSNLMGDVNAGKLADAAKIPFPEALDKLAHEAFVKDNLQDQLDQQIPNDADSLEGFTDNLNEAKMSAERALEESGGTVPQEGDEESDGKGGDKSGDAEDGKGPFGSGGGNGTEDSPNQGAKSSNGQINDEKVWESLALQSALGIGQDRSRSLQLDGKNVTANALPARRFSENSSRKGYLFIDTWHIIGPWDASVARSGNVDYSKIYPPERKLNLDGVYSSGKSKRVYDDERGYKGESPMKSRLTWQFYQSPTVEVRIPREQLANDALYFAYTEVFFERETVMKIAISSDDAARIRVNGAIIFQDTGLSPYVIAEQVREVKFQQGINRVLVRLLNGTGPCRFSLLLTPRE